MGPRMGAQVAEIVLVALFVTTLALAAAAVFARTAGQARHRMT
jgi:hypothetical protein